MDVFLPVELGGLGCGTLYIDTEGVFSGDRSMEDKHQRMPIVDQAATINDRCSCKCAGCFAISMLRTCVYVASDWWKLRS